MEKHRVIVNPVKLQTITFFFQSAEYLSTNYLH